MLNKNDESQNLLDIVKALLRREIYNAKCIHEKKSQISHLNSSRVKEKERAIRTSAKISEDFCSNIINLFKKSLYDLDYSGTIKINMVENFINFNEEIMATKGVYV